MEYIWTQKAIDERKTYKRVGDMFRENESLITEYLEQGYITKHPNILTLDEFNEFFKSIKLLDFDEVAYQSYENGVGDKMRYMPIFDMKYDDVTSILTIIYVGGNKSEHDISEFVRIVKKWKDDNFKSLDFYFKKSPHVKDKFSIVFKNDKAKQLNKLFNMIMSGDNTELKQQVEKLKKFKFD